ncbi:MAG: hypothetical protein AAB677_01785 [Patescibacteria group bacterium]
MKSTLPTIFLTVGRSMTARNLLQNDFYCQLREKYRLIILTPAFNDPRFIQEFSHPNVVFKYFKDDSHTRADIFFLGLHKYLLWSKFIALKLRYGTRALTKPEDLSFFRYGLFALIFLPLSKIIFLRDFVRWLDFYLGQKKRVNEFRILIKTEQPHLIISTSISSNIESALLKAARREKVKTIGMPKSWDNLSRAGFRTKADILVVWSQFMADQAVLFQCYKREQIKIIGILQFDGYRQKQFLWSRDRFCNEFKLNPLHPIILFTSEGKSIPEDADIALLLVQFMESGQLPNVSLLIRPHFSYRQDEKKFSALIGRPKIIIDQINLPSKGFKDHGDFSVRAMERFANSLAHAAIVVNVASTITLDAVAFDKPVINVAFEPLINIPRNRQSLASSYESDYYLEIVRTKGTWIVKSRAEFLDALLGYLANPKLNAVGRERLRQRFVGPLDGQAGQRFANLVTQTIESLNL